MKFAHLADCHIGAWRDPKLQNITTTAFEAALDICVREKVDFVLIAGDLFNTSLPGVDHLRVVVKKLKQLDLLGIPVYGIAGSHDYSPSGKSMLEILEEAGLFINVTKGDVVDDKLRLRFTIDEKTGTKITGLLGKRGSLEKDYYQDLDRAYLEQEEGYKIFLFHSPLAELKPKELQNMEAHSVSLLPKNFDYYAGGHVHIVEKQALPGYKCITYPGPLFPANFGELEKLKRGGFYIVEEGVPRFVEIAPYGVASYQFAAEGKTSQQVFQEILDTIKGQSFENKIVTLRVGGTLASGKPSEINFKEIFAILYHQKAYFVMKSTSKLASKEFQEITVNYNSIEEIEDKLIQEHLGQIKVFDDERGITKQLIKTLSNEKEEGETNATFEARLKEDVDKLISLN